MFAIISQNQHEFRRQSRDYSKENGKQKFKIRK